MAQVSTAGFRADDVSFDVVRSVLVLRGTEAFGSVRPGMVVRLLLKNGEHRDAFVASVDRAAEGGPALLSVPWLVPSSELPQVTEELDVVGHDLHLRQPPAGSDADSPSTRGSRGFAIFNGVCAMFGLLVLLASLALPTLDTQGRTSHSMWGLASLVAFVGAVLVLGRGMKWSLLVLVFSCAFFFFSYVSNLELHLP